MSAPEKVLNSFQMKNDQGEWSALYVLLNVMIANDAEKDSAVASIEAVIGALDPMDNAAEITALQAVQTSLSTADVHPNAFAEVLRRLSPWSNTFFHQRLSALFGTRVNQ